MGLPLVGRGRIQFPYPRNTLDRISGMSLRDLVSVRASVTDNCCAVPEVMYCLHLFPESTAPCTRNGKYLYPLPSLWWSSPCTFALVSANRWLLGPNLHRNRTPIRENRRASFVASRALCGMCCTCIAESANLQCTNEADQLHDRQHSQLDFLSNSNRSANWLAELEVPMRALLQE